MEKRKIFSISLIILSTLVFTACKKSVNTTNQATTKLDHVHEFVPHNGKDATCTEDGWEPYITCRLCDYTSYKEIPSLGHDYSDFIVELEPTCTEEGLKYKQCNICDDIIEVTSIDKKEHNIILMERIDPTCSQTGTEQYCCKDCSYAYLIVIEELGHDLQHYESKTPSNCFCYYWDAYDECERCGYSTLELKYGDYSYHNFVDGHCDICDSDYYTEGLQFDIESGSITGFIGSSKEVIIPQKYSGISIISLNANSFYNCAGLEKIIIPNGVTSIGSGAFSECSALKSITLPFVGSGIDGKYTHFGYIFGARASYENRYYVPQHLKEVIITKGTKIESNTFSACSSIERIVIQDSATSIQKGAFEHFVWLRSITLPFVGSADGKYTHFGYIFGAQSSDYNSKYVPEYLDEVILTKVTIIKSYAFQGCSSIKSIVIPDSVTSIEQGAFRKCDSLNTITLPFIGETIDGTNFTHFGYIFGAYTRSGNSDYVPKSIEKVIITKATKISEYAFNDCSSITSVVIPISVTSIGAYALYGCNNKASIYYVGTETQWNLVEIHGVALPYDAIIFYDYRLVDGE